MLWTKIIVSSVTATQTYTYHKSFRYCDARRYFRSRLTSSSVSSLKINILVQKEKNNKTNACRILDQKEVTYKRIPYEVEENDLGVQHIADLTV